MPRVLRIALSIIFMSQFATASAADSPADLLNRLYDSDFNEKVELIVTLSNTADASVVPALRAFADSNLYYDKKSKSALIVEKVDSKTFKAFEPISGSLIGEFKTRQLKKIATNNHVRKVLRVALAGLQLRHKDPEIRMAAATELIGNPSPENLSAIEAALAEESDSDVIEKLLVAKAMIDFNSADEQTQLKAINVLRDSLEPEVRGALVRLEKTTESDVLRKAATKAISHIDSAKNVFDLAQNIFFGISLGSVLLLSAIGLAITFGVMGVINMAHGEMMMLGAYTTFVVQKYIMPDAIDASIIVAIPLAFCVAGIVGIAIERGIIRFLYGRPLETLLATFGVSLVLQQAVRSIFSPLNQSVETPSWMSGALSINPVLSLTYNRLFIIIFSLLVLAALAIIMKKTFLGLQVRAVTQNRRMAGSMGVRTGWVDAMTFGLGSGIAGIAGVALSQLTNVGPNLGQAYIIDSFMVVVFGGVGNLLGTFIAAMGLGIVNKFIEPYAGAVLAKILVLIFIILFIQKRPRGLFALKGRAVEN